MQTPQVQEDLFYVHPTESIATTDPPLARSASTARQASGTSFQRDVRFSSLLESGEQKPTTEKTNKSSLKKGTAALFVQSHSQTGSSDDHEGGATKEEGPTVVVDPVRP